MNPTKLASGDNNQNNNNTLPISPRQSEGKNMFDEEKKTEENTEHEKTCVQNEITSKMVDENEGKLKDRIAQCRHIIESLKLELTEEKAKLEREGKTSHALASTPPISNRAPMYASDYYDFPTSDSLMMDLSYSTNLYSASVASKLNCDENLLEYEKQLQKYQNTLNMAQIEKKNAIRKQMLAKAYKLKLLEVENQCNIELLRVKQSLQCLEPLKMIASKWSTSSCERSHDLNNFEIISKYPELSTNSVCDFFGFKEDFEIKPLENTEKNGSTSSDC